MNAPAFAIDPTLRNADGCGCCDGLAIQSPVEIWNRPGLPAIAARIGTHSTIKASLLAKLSSSRLPRLRELSTRADDDLSIALLDAWATLADVVTFYQERHANECYLRTALERRSLRELARLIGYRLRPGVAASVPLSFTIEEAAGSTPLTFLDVGNRVQSIPGPGQTPQTFETVEAIDGRPEWNAIRPRLSQPQPIATDMKELLLEGVGNNIQPSETVLVVAGAGAANLAVKRVLSVTTDANVGKSTVKLADDPPDPYPFFLLALPIASFTVQPLKLTTSQVQTSIVSKTWSHANLKAQAKIQNWSMPALKLNLKYQILSKLLPVDKSVQAFRQKAAVFGHNAPKWASLPAVQRYGGCYKDEEGNSYCEGPVYPTNWDNRTLSDEAGSSDYLYLDSTYKGLVKNGCVIIESPTASAILRINDVTEVSRSDFGLNAKVSRIAFSHLAGSSLSLFRMRDTTVYVESESLPIAELPITDAVDTQPVCLDGPYPEIVEGQRVTLTGQAADLANVTKSESLTVAKAELIDGFTWLTFEEGPEDSYVRASVSFNANVALATHGETVEEVLGSGDAVQAHQRFTLRQPPLTHISADTATGSRSTLEIRVDGLLWRELPSFFHAGPDDKVYITRNTEEGKTVVQFGDGKRGARVPTGQENIHARYRKGMGADGLLDTGQLTLLQSKPLGLRSVTNALPSSGMADQETLEEARLNAPLPATTLGRVVSLQDYGDFARAFPGIGKAGVSLAWSSAGRTVFVTIAGQDGEEIADGSDLRANLVSAIRQSGDPSVPSLVKTYSPAFFTLKGTVRCDPDRLEADVATAIDEALRAAFGFDARSFMQGVARSEVLATIHRAPGVVSVDIDSFHRVDTEETLEDLLAAAGPRISASSDLGAELLLLDARPLQLTVEKNPTS